MTLAGTNMTRWAVTLAVVMSSDAIAAIQFIVKDASDNVLATVTPMDITSDLYVVMDAVSGAAFHFQATDGISTYTYEATGVTLTKGKYYQSPITMAIVQDPAEIVFE